MVDIMAAITFVTDHGTILEKARMLRLLMDVTPSVEAYQKLLDSQNPDGGFPSRPKPGSQSAVDSTLTALWQFDELGLMEAPTAARAYDFLLAMQHADGGWDENPDLPEHDLPPWIVRGEMGTRLYLSTYAAYWLAIRGPVSEPAFQKALGFIAALQEPSGRIPGYLHNNWLGISAFLMSRGSSAIHKSSSADAFSSSHNFSLPPAQSHDYTQPAEKGMAYLASLPFSEWDDSQIAWALDCLTRAGLAEDHPWVPSALNELVRRQGADGSWASEDGPAFAASATVSAIKVLKRYRLVEDV